MHPGKDCGVADPNPIALRLEPREFDGCGSYLCDADPGPAKVVEAQDLVASERHENGTAPVVRKRESVERGSFLGRPRDRSARIDEHPTPAHERELPFRNRHPERRTASLVDPALLVSNGGRDVCS